MRAMTIRHLIVAAACVQLTMVSPLLAEEPQAPEKTLYERLGGAHAIAVVVDDFVERIWVNEILNANPKNKQAMGIEKPALKFLATELVCMATGGPQKYSGRPLKDVHADLGISQKEWDAMTVDFKATLAKFEVPQKEQDELLAILASTHGDIVAAPAGGKK